MKIRIKFRKWGAMKFVGHLDMMRYFQKALRRAHIDVRYSEGFSPHQIMSFAAPLGVGLTSDGEYFDIEANDTPSSAEAIRALNAQMTDGVAITSYVRLPDDAKPAMALVAAADYRVSYKDGYQSPLSATEWDETVQKLFLEKETFPIIKKSKKSERELDLKPLVYEFRIGIKEPPSFFLRVSTGSTDNIKPELVLSSLYAARGLSYDERALQIHRLEVYARSDGELVPLEALGEEIPEA